MKNLPLNIDLFTAAIEQSYNFIVITNKKGDILYANKSFLNFTGWSLEELEGKNPRLFKSNNLPESYYKNLWDKLNSGEIWNGEFINKKKNGEIYYDRSTISPIKDFNNNITHFMAIKENITELVLSREEKRKYKIEEKKHIKNLEIMNNLITATNSAEDTDILYAKALNATLQLMNFNGGAIFISDMSQEKVYLKYKESMPLNICESLKALSINEEPLKSVIYDGKVFTSSSSKESFFGISIKKPYKSIAIIPIISNVKVIGAILAISKNPHSFTENEIDLLYSIGIASGNALNKLSLIEKIEHSLIEKEKLLEEVKKKNFQLEKMAITDGLTEIYNHKYIVESLESQIATNKKLSIIMFDIDHFKKVNDTFGHPFGDEVLIKIAKTCVSLCKKDFIVGRYGGEEFLVIMPNTTISSAYAFAENLRNTIEELKWKFENFSVTISLGVKECNGEEAAETIRIADSLLYEAKRSGRNKTCSEVF